MALRVKVIDVAGERVRIGNLQLRPQREFQEGLDALAEGKVDPVTGIKRTVELKKTVILASLRRADPSYTREQLEDFDGDDLGELFLAVMAWTGEGPGKEKPSDPPPSP